MTIRLKLNDTELTQEVIQKIFQDFEGKRFTIKIVAQEVDDDIMTFIEKRPKLKKRLDKALKNIDEGKNLIEVDIEAFKKEHNL